MEELLERLEHLIFEWKRTTGSMSSFDVGLSWFVLGTAMYFISFVFAGKPPKVYVTEDDYNDDNFYESDEDVHSRRSSRSTIYRDRHNVPRICDQISMIEYKQQAKDFTNEQVAQLRRSFTYRFFWLIRTYRFVRDSIIWGLRTMSRVSHILCIICYGFALWHMLGEFFKAFALGVTIIALPWLSVFGRLRTKVVCAQLGVIGVIGLWISFNPSALRPYFCFAGAFISFVVLLLYSTVDVSFQEVATTRSGLLGMFSSEQVTKVDTRMTLINYLSGNWKNRNRYSRRDKDAHVD